MRNCLETVPWFCVWPEVGFVMTAESREVVFGRQGRIEISRSASETWDERRW